MSLTSAARAYVADVYASKQLLDVCSSMNARSETIHMPRSVLRAHWDTAEGRQLLLSLSCYYRIVPQPLASFLYRCTSADWNCDMLDFLHPCSLFNDRNAASFAYLYMAKVLGPREDVLEALHYLSTTRSSNCYARHIMPMLHDAVADRDIDLDRARVVLTLCSRYMDEVQIAMLDMGAVSCLMSRGLVANVLHLARRMEACQRVLLAKPMAHVAALHGDANVIFHLQQLSCFPEHARAVADAVRCYQHQPYIDRLSLDTCLHLIPYLIRSNAWTALHRLASAVPSHALDNGVLTALVAAGRIAMQKVPEPSDDPRSVHDVVWYLHRREKLPLDLPSVDCALFHDDFAKRALQLTSRRVPALRNYLRKAKNWRRRKLWAMLLHRSECDRCSCMQLMRRWPFTQRIVFSYL